MTSTTKPRFLYELREADKVTPAKNAGGVIIRAKMTEAEMAKKIKKDPKGSQRVWVKI